MFTVLTQLYNILQAKEQWQLFGVMMAALILAALEVVGIGGIVSFMGLLTQPELITTNRWLNRIYQTFGFTSADNFLFFTGAVLLGIYLFKNGFAVFTIWVQTRFGLTMHYSFSKRLLNKYLYMPYSHYFSRNTSELQSNLLLELGHIIDGILMPGIRVVTQTMVATLILGLLLWSDPLLAIVIISVLGGMYTLIYLFIHRRLAAIGSSRLASNRKRVRELGKALGGVKELKVLGREAYVIESFSSAMHQYIKNMISHRVIAQSPRYLVESLAFGGLMGIVLYVSGIKNSVAAVIPIVSLYAAAAYRMLPALQQIMRAIIDMRFNRKSFEALKNDLDSIGPDDSILRPLQSDRKPLNFDRQLKLCKVSYRYPGSKQNAVEDLSLTIGRNTSVGLVGPSGAGKSTLVDIILGLLAPETGHLMVDDTVVSNQNVRGWQQNVGYVPQLLFLSDDIVTKNIAFGIPDDQIDMAAVVQVARAAHIYDFIKEELPDGFDTLIGERGIRLSGGQRQRIGIARALYHNPDVLILDEATSALDGPTEAMITHSIDALSGEKTVIIIAHRLTTLRHCDVVYVLNKGKVVSHGSYSELMQNSQAFRELARDSLRVPQ